MKTENLICSGISCSAIMCMVSFLGLVVLVEACVIFLLRIPYVEVSDEFFLVGLIIFFLVIYSYRTRANCGLSDVRA